MGRIPSRITSSNPHATRGRDFAVTKKVGDFKTKGRIKSTISGIEERQEIRLSRLNQRLNWNKKPSLMAQQEQDLHVQLLPAPNIVTQSSFTDSAITPGSMPNIVAGASIAQSPLSTLPSPSPFSPSVTNAVNPGPARKKISLSTYKSMKAKLAQTQSRTVRASPPLAHTSFGDIKESEDHQMPDSPRDALDALKKVVMSSIEPGSTDLWPGV